MSLQDGYEFDPAAFIAAAQALAATPLKAVSLPGLPACFKRELTAGDVIDAAGLRDKLKAEGLEIGRKVDIAIGLAQTLCSPAGRPIFDAGNRTHVEILLALPWKTLKAAAGAEEEEPGPNA